MSWRDDLRPGSFRGVPFKWAANSRTLGRRGFTYEFAKSDRFLDEDLGRRAPRIPLACYVLGEDYHRQADRLEQALNKEGGGLLVLPIMGQGIYRCEAGTRSERKEEGGFAVFECTFTISQSSGSAQAGPSEENTQSLTEEAAYEAGSASEEAVEKDSDWGGITNDEFAAADKAAGSSGFG